MCEYECMVFSGTLILGFSVVSLIIYFYLCKFTMSITAIDGVARVIRNTRDIRKNCLNTEN